MCFAHSAKEDKIKKEKEKLMEDPFCCFPLAFRGQK